MKTMTASQSMALIHLGNHGARHDSHITDSGMLVVLLEPYSAERLFRSVAIDRLGRTYSIMNAPTDPADGCLLVDYWGVHAAPVPGKVAIQGKDGTVRYEAQDKQRKFKPEE